MEISDVIRELCKEKGISVTDLEKELGFGNGSLTKKGTMRSDRLMTVANYFNVSMEYLLTGKETNEFQHNKTIEKAMALYSDFQSLSPENQTALLTLLRSLQNES